MPRKTIKESQLDNIGGFNVMAKVFNQQKQAIQHFCDKCLEINGKGCENCEHDWEALPNCGQRCKTCTIEFP